MGGLLMQERSRIDKVLAHMGFGSRREIKEMVKRGRVSVNDIEVRDAGQHIFINKDILTVDGKRVIYKQYIYLMMNKPQGILSATEDNYAPVVIDLLKQEHKNFNPFPVGRLDKDTEGLLLLTNDGKLAHELLSPKKHVPKTYYAVLDGAVNDDDIKSFKAGITIDDGYTCLPAELKIISSGAESKIELIIYEGKFHQVKRMFLAVGKKVKFLKRIKMGNLVLDDTLKPGEYRELKDFELSLL